MKLLIPFFFLLIIASTGCQKPSCFADAGPVTKTVRTASSFTKIVLYDNIDLVLTQDTVEGIVVEGGQNLLPQIETSISENILTLKNNVDCNWLRRPGEKITVYASVKNLEQVDYNGSGNITSTNTLTAPTLFFYSYEGAGNIDVSLQADVAGAYIHQENADITLHGSSNHFFTYTNARGSIDLKDLQVKNMVIEYGSVRNATINVTESLDAIIYHTGNLYYKGSPTIKLVTHSTGKLLHLP
jgi:hypothetical protein